ncbi:MAG: ABC transporter permease [Acidobacteriota bacterium]
MRAIFAMAGKDLRLLIRDKAGFFFTFIFPLLFAMFFGAIFSGSGGGMARIKLVVVDEDASAGSKAFVSKLLQAPSCRQASQPGRRPWSRCGAVELPPM